MAKLSEVRNHSFPVEINFGDGLAVKMGMRPHVDGQAEAKALKEKIAASDDDETTIALVQEKFCRTITNWDLTTEEGDVIPLTPEGLTAANVPVSLLGDLLVRGYEEITNSKKRGRRV